MSNKRSRATFESSSVNNDDRPPPHAPYALHGTPLPPYDPDARDDGSYVPVWKQEVTDERGRKRLHGAFTGGWSAGYFNTVGSKEGWAPTSFVSSRSNRAKEADGGGGGGGQQVEDFMDEEDLAERAESQRIETHGAFAGLGSSGTTGGAAGKGMFADLFRPIGDTIGVKLLQRMGWRQGQGIGPKVKRRVKGDEKGEMHLFAPDDAKVVAFVRKTDRKGLGHVGEGRLDSLHDRQDEGSDHDDHDARMLQTNRSRLLTQPKKIKKASFGVGVLNDTGSDDENEYDMGPKISYNRVIGGDKKKKTSSLGASNAASEVLKPASSVSKKLAQRTSTLGGFRKCHDGRLPLDGFVLSLSRMSIVPENNHPPPVPPEGWKPAKLSQNSGEKLTPYQSTADAAKTSTLDPKSRAAVLGEQQLPGKSVFDFMSPAARDRLASASGRTDLPPALGERAPTTPSTGKPEAPKTLWDRIPQLDPRAATAALQRGSSGWMPYSEDEGKRARYKSFLELRSGRHANLPERAAGVSIDEWAAELREFAQAAEVFKPISGLMASRFTSSSATPQLASDAPDDAAAAASGTGTRREGDAAEKAAGLGMYGPLTRSRQAFFPTRLLCKRFNVRPPANVAVDPGAAPDWDEKGGREVVDESRRLDVVSQASLNMMMREASFRRPAGDPTFVSSGIEGGDGYDGGNLAMGERRQEAAPIDIEVNEALEGPRAGEEVFRAVFGEESSVA